VEGTPIPAAPYFADGTELEELYTGQRSIVKDGVIVFNRLRNNVAVLAAD